MIITCNNCYKKFDVDTNLIPDNGRFLMCAGCNHKWFFKKEIFENTVNPIIDDINKDSISVFDQNNSTNNTEINLPELLKKSVEVDTEEKINSKIKINPEKEQEKKIEVNINERISVKSKLKKKKNLKILNIFIVVFISFVAFIIIVETFKYPIGKVVPSIEFMLYNLYESIKDMSLFIKDLI